MTNFEKAREGKEMSEKRHTPLPWRIEGEDSLMDIPFIEICSGEFGPTFRSVAEVRSGMDENEEWRLTDEHWANAELIVTAVNAHDELADERDRYRAMCERLAGEMEYMLCEDQLCPLCHEIRQTLAKYERMKNG